jgi:hypothetical protein
MTNERLDGSAQEELDHQELLDQFGVSPEMARFHLEGTGLSDKDWARVKRVRGQSHEIRALITIAEGEAPRLIEDLYEAETLADIEYYNRTNPNPSNLPFSEDQWNKSRQRLRENSLAIRKRFSSAQVGKSETR